MGGLKIIVNLKIIEILKDTDISDINISLQAYKIRRKNSLDLLSLYNSNYTHLLGKAVKLLVIGMFSFLGRFLSVKKFITLPCSLKNVVDLFSSKEEK